MNPNILFVTKNAKRGGTIYENQVKSALSKYCNIDTLLLDSNKNKLLLFNKVKFYHQVTAYRPDKRFDFLITNIAGVYAGALEKESREKILILHHFDTSENNYPFLYSFLNKNIINKFKSFDKIVVVANYWKDFLTSYIEPEKIKVIHNSFDTSEITEIRDKLDISSFKKRFGLPEDKIIVYAGSIHKMKGHNKVIELLNDKKYFVVTSGAAAEPSNHLHLNLSYEDYISLLCASDVTILLSELKEGWNRIAHESLLCQTGVIGTNVGGLGELLTNAGQLIYQEGSSLTSLIDKLLTDRNIPNKGFEYASQFDQKYFENEWRSLLHSRHAETISYN
jgi:glycosyltransferase involved in cell wall biosynthesis